MNTIDTPLSGLKIIVPDIFSDARGFFFESFNQVKFEKIFGKTFFVQDNHSRSEYGVLRGLHFQRPPHQQAKLVRVVVGEVFDVCVDVRPESKTFGRWHGEYLSAENHHQLWIPAGFAHGFQVTSTHAEFLYKSTDYWYPELEATIRWNDPDIGIMWPIQDQELNLSPKDANAMRLNQLMS